MSVEDNSLGSILSGVEMLVATYPRSDRQAEEPSGTISVESVLSALQSFTDITRYLNTRRSTGAMLELASEAAVQDALYLMRPSRRKPY